MEHSLELELRDQNLNIPGRLDRATNIKINVILLLVSVIWGGTFLVVQNTIKLTGPFSFLTLRFGFGTLTLALLFRKRLFRITRREIITGSIIGVFLFGGYAFQTVGLQYTTSSKAAFITGLYIPLVPIFSIFFLRHRPAIGAILGVILSITGLTLLSINDQFNLDIGLGEILVFCCAISTTLHIVSISKWAPHADAINLSIIQIFVTAILSFIAMPFAGEPYIIPPEPVWWSALFMGVIATSFALVVMNRVQQLISGTRATLYYALEAVWAGVFGFIAGEVFLVTGWIGCALMFSGMMVGELRFRPRSK